MYIKLCGFIPYVSSKLNLSWFLLSVAPGSGKPCRCLLANFSHGVYPTVGWSVAVGSCDYWISKISDPPKGPQCPSPWSLGYDVTSRTSPAAGLGVSETHLTQQ